MNVRVSYLPVPATEYEEYEPPYRIESIRLDFGIPIPHGTSVSDYEIIELPSMKCRVYGYNWTRSTYEKPTPEMLSFALHGILNFIG